MEEEEEEKEGAWCVEGISYSGNSVRQRSSAKKKNRGEAWIKQVMYRIETAGRSAVNAYFPSTERRYAAACHAADPKEGKTKRGLQCYCTAVVNVSHPRSPRRFSSTLRR